MDTKWNSRQMNSHLKRMFKMGKTWKDKNKWEKKKEDKTIKKSKKEYEMNDNNRKFNKVVSFEWSDIEEYEN